MVSWGPAVRSTILLFAVSIPLAAGVLAVATALGADRPLLRNPWVSAFLAMAVSMAFLFSQARPKTETAGKGAGAFAFAGLAFLPSGADSPAVATAAYWQGHAALQLEKTMIVDRPYVVAVAVAGGNKFDLDALVRTLRGTGAVELRDVRVADVMEARLEGSPPSAFSIVPARPGRQGMSPAGGVRWEWEVTPRRTGQQGLAFDLYAFWSAGGGPEAPRQLTDGPPIAVMVNSVPFFDGVWQRVVKAISGDALSDSAGKWVLGALGAALIAVVVKFWRKIVVTWRLYRSVPSQDP